MRYFYGHILIFFKQDIQGVPKKVLFLQILKSCNNLFSQYLTDLYLFPMCVKYQLNKSLHNFKIYKAHFLGHPVCDLTEQKHPLRYTWMSVKGCKLHYKCIEEIAHFYTKLTAPKLTLLLGGTTYMCHCLGKGTTCRPEVKLYYQHRQLQLGFHYKIHFTEWRHL